MSTEVQTLSKNSFNENIYKFFYTFRELAALEPILTNLIAITICLSVLCLLKFPDLLPNMGKYHKFLVYGMQGLAFYQVIKSASKSLFLPVIAVFTALIGILLNFYLPNLIPISIAIFRDIMVVGIIGLGISVFFIR